MSTGGTYPTLEVNLDAIGQNVRAVTDYCGQRGIVVAGVVKFSDGSLPIARTYLAGGCAQLAASRLPHLRAIKAVRPDAATMLVRLPMPSDAEEVVRWCDVSLNSQRHTLEKLNDAALSQGKTHGVLLMLDVGDLREGVIDPEELYRLALWVEKGKPGLYLAGVGSAFTCFGTIMPTNTNLSALMDAARHIEDGIGRKLDMVSGGSTSSLVPLSKGEVPEGINHLRIGTAMTLPRSLREVRGVVIPGTREDTVVLRAELIEVETKPSRPIGTPSVNWSGKEVAFMNRGNRRRAVAALGSQDIGDHSRLIPRAVGVAILGGSSDHIILDVEGCPQNWQPGDVMEFDMYYAPLLYSFATRHVNIQYSGGEIPE